MLKDIPTVISKLKWLRQEQIWPNGHPGYDLDAITHVMACTSHFPGEFIINPAVPAED
jgi:hypothetical protein